MFSIKNKFLHKAFGQISILVMTSLVVASTSRKQAKQNNFRRYFCSPPCKI